jgi:hypothetical protein
VVKSNGLEGESPSGLAERDVLFWLNELLIASNGTDSRADSLTADWEALARGHLFLGASAGASNA